MTMLALALSSLAMMQSAGAEFAAQETARLEACVAKIEANPEEAYEDGLAWLYQGNRPGARQCTALALIALDRADEGAARLENLANAPDAGSLEQRTEYLIQAGNAWMQAGAPDAAVVTLTNALKLKPGTTHILIDRASAHMLLGNWEDSIADLDMVLDDTPGIAIAHQMRAEAHLQMNQLPQALSDVEAAMAADPENIDTLVLRGHIREAIRLSEVRVLEPQVD